METEYYLKDPRLIENDNAYAKYAPVGVCGYFQDEYGFFFKNVRWTSITEFTVPEGNIAPAQGTDGNGNPPHDNGSK